MTKFYFSHINVDGYDQIVSQLRPYVNNFIAGRVHGFHEVQHQELLEKCPLIKDWFDSKKLNVRSIGIIIVPPNTIQDCHIDFINKINNPLALNFDIQNCALPRTKMYTCDMEPILSKTPSGLNYWKYDTSATFTQVAEFDLSTPVLFDNQIPHQVCNDTDQARISISFRFREDPKNLLNR